MTTKIIKDLTVINETSKVMNETSVVMGGIKRSTRSQKAMLESLISSYEFGMIGKSKHSKDLDRVHKNKIYGGRDEM